MQFEIGSITKAFNALLPAGSVRAGKVSLDDPAARYLWPADDPGKASLAKIALLMFVTQNERWLAGLMLLARLMCHPANETQSATLQTAWPDMRRIEPVNPVRIDKQPDIGGQG